MGSLPDVIIYVTYADLIQIGISVVDLAGLFHPILREKENNRHYTLEVSYQIVTADVLKDLALVIRT